MDTTNNVEKWIGKFLSATNEISLGDLEGGKFIYPWCEEVSEWLNFGRMSNWERPVILPLKLSGEKTIWFASALNSKTATQLGVELLAHIGPSYSDFNGNKWGKNDEDMFAKIIINNLSNSVYRFTSLTMGGDTKIARCLKILRCSLQKRPPRRRVAIDSGQLMRSEFDKALVLSDEPRALFLKKELLRSGRLSAENQVYLEVRFLVGLGKHREIIEEEELLYKLTDRSLPKQILQDLMTSYHDVFIQEIEDGKDPNKHINEFKSCTRAYGTFFKTRKGLTGRKVLKAFLLFDVCHRTIDQQVFENCANEIVDSDIFIQALRDFMSPPEPPTDEVEQANAAFDELDYDQAFSLLLKLEPTRDVVNKALVCARLIGTKETAVEVCKFVDTSNLDIDTDLSRTKEFYLNAKSKIDGTKPNISGWVEWLNFIVVGNNIEEAERLIEEDGGTWSIKPLLNSEGALEILLNASDKHAHIIQKAMIAILSQLEGEDDLKDAQAKSLLHTLLLINFLAEAPSAHDLEIINQLATSYLPTGLSASEYKVFVEDAMAVFNRVESQSNLPWVLDLLDILSVHSCPDAGIRLSFFVSVVEFSLRQLHRMDLAQFETLKILSSDYNNELPADLHNKAKELSEIADAGTSAHYDTIKIGIYTLVEHAAQRAAVILKEMYPGISVDTNNDHVCTERLRSLSKTSDLFVFSWRSSKHQAYHCVKDNRPKNKLFLQPLGKGSASIVKIVGENIAAVI
jgi:hypothetical protein